MQKYLYKDLFLLEEKHWWHINKRRVVKQLLQHHLKQENPKILDIGCGTGKNMEELQELGPVFGLDNSSDAIKFCKKRNLTNVKKGSAENTKYPTSFFDVITILDVLEHTDDDKVLKEIRRILKKNGLLILTVPAYPWLWSKWDEVLHHKRRYTIKTIREVLKKNQFLTLKATYLYSFLVLPILLIRTFKGIFAKNIYQSDFKLSNQFVNFLLDKISMLEFYFAINYNLAFGSSIVVVAKNEK